MHTFLCSSKSSRSRRAMNQTRPFPEWLAPASNPKQRPRDSQVLPQKERQEDNVYQEAHVGQIIAEMVRPDVSGADWGGFDIEKLRIAALARAIQCRLPYLHHCNAVYCLKDRPSCRFRREVSCNLPMPCLCFVVTRSSSQLPSQIVNEMSSEQHHRFFFPWPHQPHTCFDENTQRVALQRRLPEDDQFVVPHNLYLTMFSPSSVNVMPFDPLHGADHARGYATKYCRRFMFVFLVCVCAFLSSHACV